MERDTDHECFSLHQRIRALAALDIILSEEEWLRVHRYHSNTLQPDSAWGSVDNGAGDHLHALFTNTGTLLKGVDHESPLSPHNREDDATYPGMYDEVPEDFIRLLDQHEETLKPRGCDLLYLAGSAQS